MTCIIGIASGGISYIGADSAGAKGQNTISLLTSKCFEINVNGKGRESNEKFIFGFSNEVRDNQIVRYLVDFPSPKFTHKPTDDDMMRYLVGPFANAIRDAVRTAGNLGQNNGTDCISPFILGWRGKIFVVEQNFQVLEVFDDYIALGSGEDFAFGSLGTTEGMAMNVYERINIALKQAAKFTPGTVCEPFKIIST